MALAKKLERVLMMTLCTWKVWSALAMSRSENSLACKNL